VLGPRVAEIAPPHLLGRYISLYQLSFMVGVALGPRAAPNVAGHHLVGRRAAQEKGIA
jgi:hypothetical protein